MIRRSGLICALPVLALLIHPAAAYAAPGDPEAGSPSGSVYKLPLEAGRADAAPRGAGGKGGAPDDADGEGSFYRSENNFGSSAEVPGDPAGGDGARRTGSADPDRVPGSAASGGGRSAPEQGQGASGNAAADIADTGNTSLGAALGLLGAIGLVAAGIGVFAARRGRLR